MKKSLIASDIFLATLGSAHAKDIWTSQDWDLADKLALLRACAGWQIRGFQCDAHWSVAQLCHGLTPRLLQEFIEPLCVSALNTPAHEASAQVFLRVLRDSLFSGRGGSNLLLPRMDLGALFPEAAARWLATQGATVHTGQRVQQLQHTHTGATEGWLVPAGDPAALADAIDLLSQTPNAVLAQMGQSARARALSRHDGDIEAAKLAALFGEYSR